MTIPRLFPRSALVVLILSPGLWAPSSKPVAAQDHLREGDRIWGRVQTTSGDVYEGFIRWDRNEGSWADLLNGNKRIDWEGFEEWVSWEDSENPRTDRVIEVAGYRITWDDAQPDFASSAGSGIRFGHLRRLRVLDDDRAELELRSGERVELEYGSTDLGTDMRELLVEDAEQGMVDLAWEELEEVRFGPAPEAARSRGTRLHGTVEDRGGNRHTGYISWGLDEILATDTLDGKGDGGDREILFGEIASIRKDGERAAVGLVNGQEVVFSESGDVEPGNGGVQISDPGLGMVEVEWKDFVSLRFHEPEVPATYETFDGGHRLLGTLVTGSGEELRGWIRWDADEEYSWEILDGEWEGVVYDVELGKVAVIERDMEMRAEVEIQMGATVEVGRREFTRVTLTDGRVLRLEGSNDVDEENKGIFIQLEPGPGLDPGGDQPGETAGPWVLVRWSDFRQIRFQH